MKKLLSLIIGLALTLNSSLLTFNSVRADDFEPSDEEMNSANTYILDADDTGGDVTLQFGSTLGEYVQWNDTGSSFNLSSSPIVLDADNTGAGANVDIVANQGSDNDGVLRYNATDNKWEYSNDGGTFTDIGSGGGGGISKLFQGIDSTGGMAVTNVAQAIPLDYESIKDDYYTHSTTVNPSEVTILNEGWYRVNAMITIAAISASAGTRGNPVMHFDIDSGSGFVQQPDQTGGYIRENATESLSTSLTGTGLFYFNANDKVRITILDTVTVEPDEETVAYSSRLVISYIDRTGSSSGTVDNLKDIGDVTAPAPSDGQVLTFDNTDSKWKPETPTGGSGTLDDSYDNGTGERTITVDDGDVSWDITSTYNNVIDLQGTGDFQIQNNGVNFATFDDSGNFTLDGNQVIDNTSTEALLVRQNGDTGDIFTVDTTNEVIFINSTTLSDEEVHIGPSSGSSDTVISMENNGYVFELHTQNNGLFGITNASESHYLTIDSSTSNVGVGVTPTELMHVQKSGADNYIKVDAGSTTANYSGIMLSEYDINWGWHIRQNADTDDLEIGYQDNTPTFTNVMYLDRTTGNVGINKIDPTSTLDVTGNIAVTGTVDGVDVAAIGAQAHDQNTDTGTTATIFTHDSDNAGAGANVDIVANQGSDNDGTLRYNATTNQWEISNDGGSFAAIGTGAGHTQNTDTGTTANTFTLDNDDTGGDITLQFGTTLSETLTWDNANTRFVFSDDLRVENNLAVIGQGYIAGDHSATDSDGILNLGLNSSAWENLTWDDANDRFNLSDDLRVDGTLEANGTSVTIDADNTGAGADIDIIANQGSDSDGTLRYNATLNQWEFSNDGGAFTAMGSGGSGSAEYFDAYDSAGGTDVTAGWTDIPLGTERKKTTDFTHAAGSAEVTINTTETYVVHYAVTTDITVGTSRSESEAQLMLDTGSGYSVVPGSVGRMYNRTDAQGENTATRIFVLDLSSGDKLKIQASRISGTSTIATLAGGSALVITRIEGVGPQGPAGSPDSDLAAVQARRTTDYTLVSTYTWYDITLDSTDVETDATVIEHDNTNTDQIDIKEDGTYRITYQVNANSTGVTHRLDSRVRVNDTTVLNGSLLENVNYNGEYSPTTATFIAELSTNDYITLQAQRTTANTIINETTLTIVKLEGVKGDTGATGADGSGSTIITATSDITETSWSGSTTYSKTFAVSGATIGDTVVTTLNSGLLSTLRSANNNLNIHGYVSSAGNVTVFSRIAFYVSIGSSDVWQVSVLQD